MKIDAQKLDDLSHLARLSFEGKEREDIKKDLEKITAFCEQLNEVNTEGVEPLIYLTDNSNILREDTPNFDFTKEQALKHTYEPVLAEKGVKGERNKVQTVRNASGTPQERLYAGRHITLRQKDAADRFYQDWYDAGQSPKVTASYDGVSTAGEQTYGMAPTEAIADAVKRYRKAKECTHSHFIRAVERIICERATASDFGRDDMGRVKRVAASAVGMTFLSCGLDDLAEFYGL